MTNYTLKAEMGSIPLTEPEPRYEVLVDSAIAHLYEEIARVNHRIDGYIDSLHFDVGDKSQYTSHKVRVWKMTTAEVENAEPKNWLARDYADTMTKLKDARNELSLFEDALYIENAKYTGWSRFFLVTGGHIHSSMSCSTCYPTTLFGWLPQLSGLTEADAVAAHGPLLCSVCYPSAPVEWTVGPQSTKSYCTGSGTYVPSKDGRSYVPCPVCGKYVTRTRNGELRKHIANDPKALAVEKEIA